MILLLPVPGIPEGEPEAPLGRWIVDGVAGCGQAIEPGDILVVAQKIVSKAEGRIVNLETVVPSEFATRTAEALGGRDARVIEVVLRETRRIVRMDQGVLIAETAHGFVCANAGVDLSNVDGGASVSLLPVDPDASAARIANEIEAITGATVGVIVSDTFGRPWREGLVDVAIGIHGMAACSDCRSQVDPHGYPIHVTILADADQLAAAAGLVFRKTDRVPVCLIRGFRYTLGKGSARDLVRPPQRDLFR
ncbi:MAG: coenzyme F420-0:L-glutamate ligase [Bryobacteraceae bacterium]